MCVKLVIYKDHTRTHGQQNVKFSEEIVGNHKKGVRGSLRNVAHWTKCNWSKPHEGHAESYEQANFTTK